jgi:asparagine synthase (glutamine-hydrolysing)
MCGIAGIIAFADSAPPVDRGLLERMTESLAHRGPDGHGIWCSADGRVGLGHRRLSIIDLSEAAAQPMANEDGSLQVVFNGEIYNHAEIRRDLEAIGGHRWRTDHSDTEVILHAFEHWGIGCLERFAGMFAFALWDARSRELWLVRDRAGVKPLYYTVADGRLRFASEIKAILRDPTVPRAVDEEAFFHYLSFLTTPAPQTLFKGIRKLPAGCWFRLSADGSTEERRWWDVLDHAAPLPGMDEDAMAGAVRDTLAQAVTRRKVADVPIGVFLSGGIDSSTNVALFSEGETLPVKTFSIGYAEGSDSVADELPYARMMAERVGAEHHEIRLTQQDLLDFLPRMIDLQDEPIADPVCVPVHYLSKLARDNGVTVAQVGEGADELFWGYPAWKAFLWLDRANRLPVPRALKRVGAGLLGAAGHGRRASVEMLRRAGEGQPIFWGGAEAFTQSDKQALLSPRLREDFGGYSSWEAIAPIRHRFEEKAWEPSFVNWMSYLDLSLRLPELLLMRVDKMSMGVGLEARVPFLDHDLVTLAMSLPQSAKTRGNDLKHVLKTAVSDLLPPEIIHRRKQGFAVPVRDWFGDRLGEQARDSLDSFMRETDFFDAGTVESVFRRGPGPQPWYLLNFALWWKHHVAG